MSCELGGALDPPQALLCSLSMGHSLARALTPPLRAEPRASGHHRGLSWRPMHLPTALAPSPTVPRILSGLTTDKAAALSDAHLGEGQLGASTLQRWRVSAPAGSPARARGTLIPQGQAPDGPAGAAAR